MSTQASHGANGLPGQALRGYPPSAQTHVAPSIFADVPGLANIGMGDPASASAAEGNGRSAEEADSLLQDPFAHEDTSQSVSPCSGTELVCDAWLISPGALASLRV